MTDLAERLDRLGLSGYAKRLALEGFDTWETVLDITESDLYVVSQKHTCRLADPGKEIRWDSSLDTVE